MSYSFMRYLPKTVRRRGRVFIGKYINQYRVKGKVKIFCIGQNKTGTTSFKQAFIDLGFVLGNQKAAERLLPYYREAEFQKIIDYCNTAQVFQDIPFSFPDTFRHLDLAFPNSKFVLTVRDSAEQWYDSMVKFESKLFGKQGALPTRADLQNATYVWKGWVWEIYKLIWPTPEHDLYNKELLMEFYNKYNQSVIDYFKDRPNDLIVVNVAEKGSYSKLMNFLNIESRYSDFPWENKTSNIKPK